VLSILSIRIITNDIGTSLYAAYAILISFIAWFELFDLGTKRSLQNYITEILSNNGDPNEFLFNGMVLNIIITSIFSIIIILNSTIIAKFLFSSFAQISIVEKNQLIFTTTFFGSLYTISNTMNKVWYGQHKGFYSNLALALAAVLYFAVFLFIGREVMVNKVLFYSQTYIIAHAIFFIVPFSIVFKKLNDKCKLKYSIMKIIILRGIKFWYFALLSTLILQVDYLIMANLLTPSEISKYNVLTKVFNFGFFIYTALLLALWPTISEAFAQNRFNVIKKNIKTSLLIGFSIITIITIILTIYHNNIIKFLLPDYDPIVSYLLIFIIYLYFLIRIWTDTFAVALQSKNELQILIKIVLFQVLINIIAQIIFCKLFGVEGIFLGLLISYLLTVSWYLPLRFNKILEKL